MHWAVVLVLIVVLFGGKGKISDFMGDFAKGIKAFKKGLADDDEPEKKSPDSLKSEEQKRIEHKPSGDVAQREQSSAHSDDKVS
jgi:sec-independent protein translocase protein TatA